MAAERIAYRPTEALEVFPIGRTLLYEKMRTGEIASFRVGRARFIPRESLLGFMRRSKSKVPRPAASTTTTLDSASADAHKRQPARG
jgi:hypothetical protein